VNWSHIPRLRCYVWARHSATNSRNTLRKSMKEDAMREALRKESNADALINITVDRVSKYFILRSQTCTEVRAMAVRIDRTE